MGSLFKSPSIPSSSVVQYSAPSTSINPTIVNTTDSEPTSNINDVNNDTVQDVVRRVARGRNSTIQTSYRGVLAPANTLVPQRKNLLGE